MVTADLDRPSLRPIEIEVPFGDIRFGFEGLRLRKPEDRDVVYSKLESLLSSLNRPGIGWWKAGQEDGRALVARIGRKQYLVQNIRIEPNTIGIEAGSIKGFINTSLAAAVSVYTGIAVYPDFKKGLAMLRHDVDEALGEVLDIQAFEQRLLEYFVEVSRNPEGEMPPPAEPYKEIAILREEDLFEELRTAIRNAEESAD